MKLVRYGLSRRRHLPCIWIADKVTNYSPLRLDVFHKYHGVKLATRADGNVNITKNGYTFTLTPKYAEILLREYVDWHRHYKAPFNLKDKTVLDVGAGCGETIFFYALQGCRNFIAVEPNPTCAALLKQNADQNGLNIKVLNENFKPEHLELDFDFLKCDCEGGEGLLLTHPTKQAATVEVHSPILREGFIKLGYHVTHDYGNGTYIMRNTP